MLHKEKEPEMILIYLIALVAMGSGVMQMIYQFGMKGELNLPFREKIPPAAQKVYFFIHACVFLACVKAVFG